MGANIKKIFSIEALIIMANYPAFFLYAQNANEVSLLSSVRPSVFLTLFYSTIFLISIFLIKDFLRASLFMFVIIVLGNHFKIVLDIVKLAFPDMKYWHMLSLIIYFSILIFDMFKRKITDEFAQSAVLILVIVANFYLLVNLVPLVPYFLKVHAKENKIQEDIFDGTERPNIYYLVFDEYSSNEFMKKYYDYDNSELISELKDLKFNISLASSNEAYLTAVCMTNIMNLDYIFDMDNGNDKNMSDVITRKRKENRLFQILNDFGYRIIAVGEAGFYGLEDSSQSEAIEKSTIDGKTYTELVFSKTFLYPIHTENSSLKLQNIEKSRNYMNHLRLPANSGNFVLFHIELPHTAFVVDQHGLAIAAENRLNWEEPKYYLGQYQYASDMMLDIVSHIIKNDPDSIIILCSDHSARGLTEFSDLDKCQIFNTVYFQGKHFDIEGLSGINTLRKVLNEAFALDLEMIETFPLEPVRSN